MRLDQPLKPTGLGALGLGVTSLVIAAFAWWPALWAYPNTQGGDGPVFHKMLEAARASVVRYHEMPLWNPYECGGLPLWDNPQGIAAAPLAWLTLFFGTTRTLELWVVIHAAIGFASMFLFARLELKVSRASAMAAAGAWSFSGFHLQHYSGGHVAFVAFLYFPLAFLLWRRAEKDDRAAVGLGLLVAWMFYEGAVYPLPHLAVFLAAETLTRAWPPRRALRIARAGAIVGVVGVTVAAARMLPVLDQLRAHTRPIGAETDALQWETLKAMFLARAHDRGVVGQSYVWPEYGTYFGPILLTLALIGMAVAGIENVWIVALLGFAFVLMLGHAGKYAPWSILKGHVFPFKEMRVPSRFRVEVSLFFAMLVGLAVEKLPRLSFVVLRRRARVDAARAVVVALAMIGVGDVIGAGITWIDVAFTGPPEVPVRASTNLFYGGADTAALLDQPRQNRGRLQCWEEWGFGAGAPLWEGDVPQARAAGPGAVVEVANRTANTFTIDVDVKTPSRVLVNSSYDRGWRTDVGVAVEQDKQLAIDLPPGRHRVHLKYWPHGLTAGLALTALGLVGVVGFFVRDRRRRRATA